MKKNLVLFGAGFYGKNAIKILKDHYSIKCIGDNNPMLQGNNISGIPVVDMTDFCNEIDEDTNAVITTKNYTAITKALIDHGIHDYYVLMEGFLYHCNPEETMMPVELFHAKPIKKKKDERNVLFVQNAACIRTHKIASMMRDEGYHAYLLYTLSPPDKDGQEFADVYGQTFGLTSATAIREFILAGEIDLIHCSNAPDILTNIAITTGKPVIHDTHDMQSLWGYDSIEDLSLEYIANTRSDGNIYTSGGVVEIAKKKFHLDDDRILCLENYILDQMDIEEPLEKLSAQDGEIHCVYEGGMNGTDPDSDRFFEPIWKKIIACGIHIHYYSQYDPAYCERLAKKSEYLHYEGNMGTKQLIREMTKYDLGLAIFQVNDRNRVFMETGTANKVYEYLNAGLPVVVGDLQSYADFVNSHNVGIQLDFKTDIRAQLEVARGMHIEKDFLRKNKLTMKSKAGDLAKFYEKTIQNKKSRQRFF